MSFPTTQYNNNPAPIVVPYVWSDASGKYIPQREAGSITLDGISLTVDQVGLSGDPKVGITGDIKVGITGGSVSIASESGINFGRIILNSTAQQITTTNYDGYMYIKSHSGNLQELFVGDTPLINAGWISIVSSRRNFYSGG